MNIRDYIYIFLAVFMSAFFVTAWSMYSEYQNDFYRSTTYEALKDKEGGAAIEILEEARKSGPQKNTFQIHISHRLGMEYREMNEMEEAERYLTEVVFMKTKLIANLWYDLSHYNSLKNSACVSLVRVLLDGGEFEKAKYFLDLSDKFPFGFGCGTAALQYQDNIANLHMEYAMKVGDIQLLITQLQTGIFISDESSKSVISLVNWIKSTYSPKEIKKELADLEREVREIELLHSDKKLPEYRYEIELFDADLVFEDNYYFLRDERNKYISFCESINKPSHSSTCRFAYLRDSILKSYFYKELTK